MNKNPAGGGSIRQRKNGRWEARATIGYDPQTGKQIQKSFYGKTQNEVRKKLNECINAIDNNIYTEPTKLNIAEWFEIWLTEYTAHLKPLTLKSYKTIAQTHIIPKIGKIKLIGLNPALIQNFINGFTDISPKTVKNIHGVLHAALEQAVIIGYIPRNPAAASRLPRWNKPELKPLDLEQTAQFMEAVKGERYERLFITALFTGLRRSELLGLTWNCIDFKNGVITVYRQLQKIKGVYTFAPLKNNKTRSVALSDTVIGVLKAQRIEQNENRLKAGKLWNNSNLVFTNEIGEHIAEHTLYKHFKRIAEKLNRPELRFHDLRHTYAVNALQAGDSIKTVQEQLGHYSAAFTLDTYAHITKDIQKQSAQNMQNFIDNLKL